VEIKGRDIKKENGIYGSRVSVIVENVNVDENGRVVILVKKCDRVGLLEMSEWDDI
jgi:hypothetical protein